MAKIIVLGAGICGLGTALLLARDGHDVTLLERDDNPVPDTPQEAWDRWGRKGVAQFRQPHNFMPGMRRLLDEELPEIQAGLPAAGAFRWDLWGVLPPGFTDRSPRPIDAQLWTYTCRRPTGEWVFFDAARREPRLTLRRGVDVAALSAGPSARAGIPHVAGVTSRDGETWRADLVVDATGRASRAPKWLAAIGAPAPHEEEEDCGFTYYTRYFRGAPPEFNAGALTGLGTLSLLTLPGDNGTWSVTIFAASDDKALRRLKDADTWTRVVRACPLHAHWLDGEPITDVLVMGGVVDRYRRFVVDGRPVATGFVAVADAWACTNPSAGRGLTVGMIHGRTLRDVLRETAGEPYSIAERFDEATERVVAPWYHAQIAVDRFRFAQMRSFREGRPAPPPEGPARQYAALLAAMPADPDLFRAGLEYVGTLTPIQEILRRPEVAQRIAAVAEATGGAPPPAPPGPDRAQLLALVGG